LSICGPGQRPFSSGTRQVPTCWFGPGVDGSLVTQPNWTQFSVITDTCVWTRRPVETSTPGCELGATEQSNVGDWKILSSNFTWNSAAPRPSPTSPLLQSTAVTPGM